MNFDALPNAAYRVSLHGPGAELQGVFKHPPRPGAFGAEQRPSAGYDCAARALSIGMANRSSPAETSVLPAQPAKQRLPYGEHNLRSLCVEH